MLLEKYTSKWIKDFEDIKGELEIALDGIEYTIEHVGSTAVPHLDAKPIIDVDIIYSQLSDFEKIREKLGKLGYYHNGNQGIQHRDVFKRNGALTNQILDTIRHHLYACPVGSKALERHILSRDFLRKNDWARVQYQQMKYELAEKANQDRKLYATLKEQNINAFIDTIVEAERVRK